MGKKDSNSVTLKSINETWSFLKRVVDDSGLTDDQKKHLLDRYLEAINRLKWETRQVEHV